MDARSEFRMSLFPRIPSPAQGKLVHHSPKNEIDAPYDVRRMNAINDREKCQAGMEIFDSEKTYLKFLETIEEHFKPKFLNAHNSLHKQIHTLFGEITPIYKTSQELVKAMREKPFHMAFTEMLPFLKLYSTYATHYPDSLKAYAELMSNDGFRKTLEEAENDPRCEGNKLSSFLIMPVQRIPRYILLLKNYDATFKKEMHCSNMKVINALKELSHEMSSCMTAYERAERILEIQKDFGLQKHIFEPGRVLIKEGTLFKRCRENGLFEEKVVFLFNDVLIYGQKRILYRAVGMSKYEPSCMFALRHTFVMFKKTEGVIVLKCGDVYLEMTSDRSDTLSEWHDSILNAIHSAKTLRQTLRKDSFNKKVMHFDKSFWKRRRQNIRSIMRADVARPISRVFSRRRQRQDLNETDFLNGVQSLRKRNKPHETLIDIISADKPPAHNSLASDEDDGNCRGNETNDLVRDMLENEFFAKRRRIMFESGYEPPVLECVDEIQDDGVTEVDGRNSATVFSMLQRKGNQIYEAICNTVRRLSPPPEELEITIPTSANVMFPDEIKEPFDEEDRRPRELGNVRNNLRVSEIRKLSYQRPFDFLDEDDESENVSVDEPISIRPVPWWAEESAPPAIRDQRQGRSLCILM
ncbi:unnamed protein product [Caenorhabditis bovis]|uniref:DH domain-containing protein n=1 Tax=Caenorhabditis bovis TaxID=2654633 RepID=A0A8S1EEQ4_9PELO|nr:unnamed protein product [Caenorhabditis bovis]